jgi:hypothetical protein
MGRIARLLLLVAAGCSGDPPAFTQLTLASSYDLIGVRRNFPDGLTVASHEPLTLALEDVAASGESVRARLLRTEGNTPAVELRGTFDAVEARIAFSATSGPVWSNRTEVIEGIGGNAIDGTPVDGLANEIVGFVQTSSGSSQVEASFLAVARDDRRPNGIDASAVNITTPELGRVRIVGSAGAAPRSGGIEVFRHQLIEAVGEFSLHQASDDGSFDVNVSGFSEDLFLLRVRLSGRASTGIAMAAP